MFSQCAAFSKCGACGVRLMNMFSLFACAVFYHKLQCIASLGFVGVNTKINSLHAYTVYLPNKHKMQYYYLHCGDGTDT